MGTDLASISTNVVIRFRNFYYIIFVFHLIICRVIFCLTRNEFFPYVMARTLNEMMMKSTLLDFFSAISLKQQSVDRNVILRGHFILVQNELVCSYS
jgi:hypothetical protein